MTRKEERNTFITIWQSAASLQEVAEKTGLTERQAINKASYYRNRLNIPLKKFRTLSSKELRESRKLARELA